MNFKNQNHLSFKIKDIQIEKVCLHFHKPFKIAYEEVVSAEMIIIKIIDKNGFIGFGCASPDSEVTNEKIEDVLNILEKKLTPDFFTYPIQNWYLYHTKIQEDFLGFPSAQAAIEEAYFNLWSQFSKISLCNFFGGYRKNCETMITIGIKNQKETLIEVQKRLQAGFKIIKLKCGLNVDEDLEKIERVKSILPSNIKFILDANQGYDFEDAKKLLLKINDLRITLIEQPINAKNIAELKELHFLSKTPVIADEAVITVADAVKLLTNNYVAGVNIKLVKCGGPINFIKIFHLAKSLGKIIMLGCMYESNISMTTGANLALGLPIDFIDLDSGHLDFYDDPFKGGMILKKGMITGVDALNIK